VIARVLPRTARMVRESNAAALNGFPPPHVAGLGATLFTDHLISVEVAGAILFVALVGAVCIATPKPPIRPQVPPSTSV
jgi:NADH-quinone oxidoreductase subunit J